MRNFYLSSICKFSSRQSVGWLIVLLIGLLPTLTQAQSITGTVFRDFNSNGGKDNTTTLNEVGVGGVRVTAYNAAGTAVATTISSTVAASMGGYTLSVGNTNAYRVEFTNLPSGDFDAFRGTGSATSVQFANGGTANVNLGINYPTDYCQTNPDLVTSCYVFGNQQGTTGADPNIVGTYGADPVLISFPYNSGSRSILELTGPGGAYDLPTSHQLMVRANQVGTILGLAYARKTKKLYSAAFFKKHAGFGPGGPGAIYVSNATSTSSVSQTFTVPGATTNSHNTADYNRDNDNIAWDAVGKTSLGGMDLSDDEDTLYVMNLQNRTLYALNPTSGAVLGSQAVPLTLPGCPTTGDVRPFAVEYHRGKVYIGIVCSAESSNAATDLKAYLYAVNPATLAFGTAPVFQTNLNYPRGKAASTGPGDWLPWKSTYTNVNTNPTTRLTYPMPLFTNIAFDNGDLIIGLRDRIGDIAGSQSKDNPATQDLYQGRIAGDILRAGGSPETGWTLEDNGRSETNGTAEQNTGQGPGVTGAEFYHGDSYPISTGGVVSGVITGTTGIGVNHDEVSLGTMTQIPGFVEVAAVVYDPTLDNEGDGFFDGGIRWLNNTTGAWAQSYRIYNGVSTGTAPGAADFGKAAGLGELIPFCDLPPIQIGNRVWNDTDNDGIQDPGEPALAGIPVILKGPGLPPAGTTVTTGTNGEYYFSNATGTNAPGFVYSLTGLTSGGSYSLCFPLTSTTLTLSSKANSATGTNADAIDADPNAAGIISFTLGQAGQNNFTYDAGYKAADVCSLTATATPTICNSATNQYTVSGSISLTGTSGGIATITDGAKSMTVTVPANATSVAYSLTGLISNGTTHTVSISLAGCGTASRTYVAPVSCTNTPCVDNLLLNPGFEQGFNNPTTQTFLTPPPSWTGGNSEVNPGASFEPADGMAFGFTLQNSPTMCQSVSATPGSSFTLTFFAGVHQVNGQTVRLEFLNGATQIGTPQSFSITHLLSTDVFGGPYTLQSGIAPAGTTALRVCAVGNAAISGVNGYAKIDNLCLRGTFPAPCSLSVAVNAPACNTATNNYTATGTVSLSNSPAGSLTITDNGTTVAVVSVTAGQTSASFSVTGLSNASSHTVTVTSSNQTCGTARTTYAAPASCTVCSLSLTTSVLANGQVGSAYSQTLTTSGATAPATFTVSAGSLPAGLALNATTGVISGTPTASGTASFTVKVTDAKNCTAVALLTITTSAAPVCSLTATATPTICNSINNTYTVTGTVSATNAGANSPQTLTVSVNGINTVVTLTGNGPVSYTLSGLTSDGMTKTVSVVSSASSCGMASVTYPAPASCTVAPPALAVVVGTPVCNTATNNYTTTATVSLSNATAGTLTLTENGTVVGTVSVTAGQTTASFTLTGVSGSQPQARPVIASLTVATSSSPYTASTIYAAPPSCTVCSLSLTTSMLANGQVGSAYSQTLTTSGATAPATFTLSAGSLPAGLTLNATTGVISGTPTASGTASFTIKVTDAKNCTAVAPLTITTSALPVCSLTATATPTICNSTNNTYTVTGTVSATNAPGTQSLTISVGTTNTVVVLTGNGPASYTFSGLTSDGLTKTVSVVSSASSCGMASVTYAAPVSCSVAPSALAVVVGTPICNTATNKYITTATVSLTNAPAGTLTLTDNGTVVGTVSVTAGQTTASFTLTGVSGSSPAAHSVVATLSNGVTVVSSTTYATPASCTVCSLSLTTSMLANGQVGTAYSQTLTASGATAPATYTVSAGNLPAGLALNASTGVISGAPTSATTTAFTVVVTDSKSCSAIVPLTITTSAEPVCSLTATATPGLCSTLTNTYSVTGTLSGTNLPASQNLTVTVGTISTVVVLTNDEPETYTLTGLESDGMTKTVTVVSSASACGMTSVTYTAPASCTMAPALASLGDKVFEDVNRDGIQDGGDLPISGATVTLLQNGSAVATTTTSVSGLYSFTGLTPGIPYSVSFTTPSGFSATTSANVGDDALDSDAINGLTGPYTLTAGENNPTVDAGFVRPPVATLDLSKLVSATKAELGDVISYTVVLVNTGPVGATSIVVSESYSAGLTLVPGSVSVSAGSFTPGLSGGQWAIASLPANATATLIFSASIVAEGVVYNTASIPGDEAKVCTSVPFKVCKGTAFGIELTAPTGYSRYQWYYTAPGSGSSTVVSDGTMGSYTATRAGEYRLVVDEGLSGLCPNGSCCPVIIEEIEVPLYTAQGKNPTCVGTTPQANGEIKLLNLGVDPTEYLYQLSAGSSFSATGATPLAPVPADGLVATGLAQGSYTVRVWVLIDGEPSCPRDVVVVLLANCACPEEICVPIIIRKTKR